MKLEIVFIHFAFFITMVTGPLVAIHKDAHLRKQNFNIAIVKKYVTIKILFQFISVTCYRQSCEMKLFKDKGERWKCSYDGDGIQEKCAENSFCFEGRANDSYLRFCIKKSDFIKNVSKGDMNVIEKSEGMCTGETKPKLIPIFFPKGKECYCLEPLCNKDIPLPEVFDVKGY